MAWGGITARGSATEQSADNSIGISPSANLTVGKIVIVNVVVDNIATADGASNNVSLSDTQGNIWSKVSEYTDSDGVAADGVTVATFVTRITTQIGTGDTITATTTSNTTDKIISIFEATVASGYTFAVEQVGIGQGAITASVSALPYKEYLLIGHGGAEGVDSTKTPDADYTERFDLRTNSSGSAITQHVVTRIASLTSDTCTSSAWTNTNPMFLLVALYETPIGHQYSVGIKPRIADVRHDNPLRRGLVFDAPLFENGGISVLDIAGNRKGTLTNTPLWKDSKFGKVVEFSSGGLQNQVIPFATLSNQDSLTNISIEVLVRPYDDADAGNPKILIKKSGASSSTRRWALNIENLNKFEFQAGWSTTSGFWEFGTILYREWYHVVITYSFSSTSNDPTIHINGVPVTPTETQAPTGSVNSDDSNFYIGNTSAADNGFGGQVAYVRYWNRILSKNEIIALYSDPFRLYKEKTQNQSLVENAGVVAGTTTTDDREFETRGELSTTSDREFEIRGQDSSTSDREFEVTGSVVITSDREFETRGESSSTNDREFETRGESSTTNDREFEVTGSVAITDTREFETRGESSSTNDREFELTGSVIVTDDREFEIRGEASSTNDREFETRGQDSSTNDREFEITGVVTATDDREFEIRGQATSTNDREFEITGSVSVNDTREFETRGQATSTNDREFEVTGSVTITSDREFETRGQSSSTSDREFEVTGSIAVTNDREFEIRGQATSTNDREFEITGSVDITSDREFETRGQSSSTSDREFELTGSVEITNDREFETRGQSTSTNDREFETRGYIVITNDREFETRGQSTSSSDRDFQLTGTSHLVRRRIRIGVNKISYNINVSKVEKNIAVRKSVNISISVSRL